jgi:DHA1 family bicyclomycin/chloramphenicol resistance-like MFS transporter
MAAARRRPEPGFTEFVILVALMMGVTAFAVDAVLPAFPAIGESFAIQDPNQLQLVVYVYMLGFGAAQLLFGPASDVVGRRPAYLAGAAVFLIGCAMAMFAHDLTSLLVARFVQGTGAASGRVLSTAIVRDRFAGRDMARVMSLNMTVFIMVPVFAPAIGSLLLLLGDWHGMFGAMLLLGVALAAWFWLRMPETLAEENRMPFSVARIAGGFRTTLTCRITMGYATAVGLLFGCVMSMVGSAQQIFTDTFDLGPLFPLAFAGLAGSMGVAALANAKAVSRFGMRRISHASMLALVAVSLVQVAAALATGGRPPLWLFAGLLAASQFLLGLAFPNMNALALEPMGKIAGTASSLIGLYTTIAGALCGLLIGGAFDGTVLPIALGYLILAVLAAGVVAWTERGRLFGGPHRPPT